ncbi:MAG: hypothetical protein IPJ65_43355 [Archangiaceae bacterium]|nr:hypothetical protein [Archangiaceae bacterium]
MPALDVENLFAQLDMIAVDELGLPEDVSARLQASLERSYLASGPELTAEARAYFRAWCSSDRLLHAVRRHGADLDSPAARRDTERQLQKMWESAGLSG